MDASLYSMRNSTLFSDMKSSVVTGAKSYKQSSVVTRAKSCKQSISIWQMNDSAPQAAILAFIQDLICCAEVNTRTRVGAESRNSISLVLRIKH